MRQTAREEGRGDFRDRVVGHRDDQDVAFGEGPARSSGAAARERRDGELGGREVVSDHVLQGAAGLYPGAGKGSSGPAGTAQREP